MALHDMKLAHAPFAKLKDGRKTLELRLFDEKRQAINPGDQITFTKFPGAEERLTIEVTGLLRYAHFAQLLADVPAAWLGVSENDKAELASSMYGIYMPEDEREYGVLGIRLNKKVIA